MVVVVLAGLFGSLDDELLIGAVGDISCPPREDTGAVADVGALLVFLKKEG